MSRCKHGYNLNGCELGHPGCICDDEAAAADDPARSMPPADPTPPLTAERIAKLVTASYFIEPEGAGEAFRGTLAALTAELAQRTAELEEARRHTEWADNLVNSAHVDWLGEVARERQRRMQAEADCAQRTAERDAVRKALAGMVEHYERYSGHSYECALQYDDDCSCGLNAKMAQARAALANRTTRGEDD